MIIGSILWPPKETKVIKGLMDDYILWSDFWERVAVLATGSFSAEQIHDALVVIDKDFIALRTEKEGTWE